MFLDCQEHSYWPPLWLLFSRSWFASVWTGLWQLLVPSILCVVGRAVQGVFPTCALFHVKMKQFNFPPCYEIERRIYPGDGMGVFFSQAAILCGKNIPVTSISKQEEYDVLVLAILPQEVVILSL